MKKVYICHPFSADPEGNAKKVTEICRDLVAHGYIPIAPQIYLPQFMAEKTQRDLAMKICVNLLWDCDEVFVFGLVISAGMADELSAARDSDIPVHGAAFTRVDGKKRIVFYEVDK